MIQSIPPAGKTRAIRPTSRIKQFIVAGDEVRIPGWVVDYASFHKWTLSDAFPQSGRVDYIDDELWADLTMEEFVTHNQIKAEISFVLTGIVRASDTGAIIADRMRINNTKANLSCEPDLAFATWSTFQSGRLNAKKNKRGKIMELVGTPDMVLEVLSDSSETKDDKYLRAAYRSAGVAEYWLVDARTKDLRFDVLQLRSKGYVADVTADGWSKSAIFGRQFRLVASVDPLGQPRYRLEMR